MIIKDGHLVQNFAKIPLQTAKFHSKTENSAPEFLAKFLKITKNFLLSFSLIKSCQILMKIKIQKQLRKL